MECHHGYTLCAIYSGSLFIIVNYVLRVTSLATDHWNQLGVAELNHFESYSLFNLLNSSILLILLGPLLKWHPSWHNKSRSDNKHTLKKLFSRMLFDMKVKLRSSCIVASILQARWRESRLLSVYIPHAQSLTSFPLVYLFHVLIWFSRLFPGWSG